MNVEMPPIVEAVASRRSIRSFLPVPVPRAALDRILAVAACAPSDMNLQPWRVHVVQGAVRDRLCHKVRLAAERREASSSLSMPISDPCSRDRALSDPSVRIPPGANPVNDATRAAAWLRNFDLFGAPVGLFLSMSRSAAASSQLDCGMFLQNVMLVARGYGLDTCPQRSWCDFHLVVCEQLGIPDSELLICGMALGYPALRDPLSEPASERKELSAFVRWLE